jgi:hypothetical protein
MQSSGSSTKGNSAKGDGLPGQPGEMLLMGELKSAGLIVNACSTFNGEGWAVSLAIMDKIYLPSITGQPIYADLHIKR